MDSAAVTASTSGAAAYERLRRAIVRVELAPGTRVSEAQLVDSYRLSKAAVRAALARLRAEGLVRAEPRRGHVITALTMRDVVEIYDLRLLLEPPAAAAAAATLDRAELKRLRALAEPDVDFDDPDSLERFLRANRSIHLAITAAAGNRRAAQIVERLLDDSERARLVALRPVPPAAASARKPSCTSSCRRWRRATGPRAAELMAVAIWTFRDELVESLQAAALDMPLAVA
jgi:DNA-binding GntR family transcriptional regulator